MNKRRNAIQAALSTKKEKKLAAIPSMPSGDIDISVEAKIDADVNFSRLKDSLEKAGLTFSEFLKQQSGITLSKPERQVTTPSGETYTVATTHLLYNQLKELCDVDADNVRDASEREEAALSDIIDEIGMGLQLMPIIAYVNPNGRYSIMEGSRRLSAALIRRVGLDVDIFDRKPSEETIRWVVEVSDKKKGFSYYEKGKLYNNLMESHGWTQSELEKNRGYTQQDISLSLAFSNTPKKLIDILPVKTLPQAYVQKFNTATKNILERNLLEESIDKLKLEILGIDNLPLDKQAKVVSNKWCELARQVSSKKDKGPKPVFEAGLAKAFIRRTKSGSNISLHSIPKELEEEVINAIREVLEPHK